MNLQVFPHRDTWIFRLVDDAGQTKAGGRGFVTEATAREAAEIALTRLAGLPPRDPSREHVSARTASLIKDWVKRNYEAA